MFKPQIFCCVSALKCIANIRLSVKNGSIKLILPVVVAKGNALIESGE